MKRSGNSTGQKRSSGIKAGEWRVLTAILILALLAPLLANDIPLYARKEDRHHFPVFSLWLPGLFPNEGPINWQDRANWGDQYLMPPIPYHSRTIDMKNAPFLDPFDQQDIPNWRWRHWLGTDDLGRDVLAGLLHGASISLVIGVAASLVAVCLGLLIGGFAGYFGDDQYRPRRGQVLSAFLSSLLFLVFAAAWYDSGRLHLGTLALLLTIAFLILKILSILSNRITVLQKRITLPADLIVLRVIETIRSIPDLFLIIGIAAIFRRPGLMNLVFLIAFLRWPVIARYVRAEMLKVREQDYIHYARGTGLPASRVFWRHALPNAMTPVWVLGAFSVAIAILLESSLSFLGIGIPPEWVTWGSMLNLSRRSLEAWHLAIFPGLAMFGVIYYFNYLGERMEDTLRTGRGLQA